MEEVSGTPSVPGVGKECVRILRVYLNACSTPIQGPHSGALFWVTSEEAHRALTALEALCVRP